MNPRRQQENRTNRLCLSIIGAVLATGCVRPAETGSQTLELPAADLVRRNLFLLSDEFPIRAALAFQYGNVQVDGSTGGMLYRFATTTAAVDWLAAEWSLERVAIGSVAEIPLDFLTRTPEWWTPGDGVVDAYYSASAELVPAGRRDLILVFDRDEEVLYAVEHYDRLTGP